MRWFKHFSDARRNPKLRQIERQLGEVGYARAFKLLEIVADRGGTGAEFRPNISLRKPATTIDWLADELGITPKDAEQSLTIFSAVGFISSRSWRYRVISIPQLAEYKDEWARKNSRATPESHRSKSLQNTDTEIETEIEAETEAKTEVDLAAKAAVARLWFVFLKKTDREGSKDLRLTPRLEAMGLARFADALRMTDGDRDQAEAKMETAMEEMTHDEFLCGGNPQGKRLDYWDKVFGSEERFGEWLDRATLRSSTE